MLIKNQIFPFLFKTVIHDLVFKQKRFQQIMRQKDLVEK
jgi:hypothetical protein